MLSKTERPHSTAFTIEENLSSIITAGRAEGVTHEGDRERERERND